MQLAPLSRVLVLCAGLATATPLSAAGTGGCGSFDFPLATELSWMTAGDAIAAKSGDTLEVLPDKAVALALVPTATAKFEVQPTGKQKHKPEEAFAALVTVAGVSSPGLHQVSLSGPGWIDVVQNGAPLKAVAHTGKSDCEGLRKSVRFEIASGPFTIQISDAPASSLRLTIRKAD